MRIIDEAFENTTNEVSMKLTEKKFKNWIDADIELGKHSIANE